MLDITIDAPGAQAQFTDFVIRVPEPAAGLLAGLALVGLVGRRRA